MHFWKRLIGSFLCGFITLTLACCGREEPVVTTIPEETTVVTESVAAQVETAPEEPEVPVDLEVSYLSFSGSPRIGEVEICGLSAREQSGVVRYTIDYCAPAGMSMELLNQQWKHVFDRTTTDRQESLVFEMDSDDVRKLCGTFDVRFAFGEEDYYLMKVLSSWPVSGNGASVPEAGLPEEFEVGFFGRNALVSGEGTVETFAVKDGGENWQFVLSHTLPSDLDGRVYVYAGEESRPVAENAEPAGEGLFRFEIPKEDLSEMEGINVLFASEDAGYYEVSTNLPLRVQKTNGAPIGEPVPLGFAAENASKATEYEIQGITAQKLDNGYVRFVMDMTLPADQMAQATLCMDLQDAWKNQTLSSFQTTGMREQYVLDIDQGTLAASQYLTLGTYTEKGSPGLTVYIPHSDVTTVVNDAAVVATIPLECFLSETVDKTKYQLHGCTAQILESGNVRYTLTCTMPEGILGHFFDSMTDGKKVNSWYATGAQSGEHTITLNVDEMTANVETDFVFFADPFAKRTGAIFVINNTAVLDYAAQEAPADIAVCLVP